MSHADVVTVVMCCERYVAFALLSSPAGPALGCWHSADAMAFANPVGPETINGRLAMVGVLAAIGAELSTGQSFFTQFESATPVVLATWAIIALASLVPIMKGEST